MEHETAHELTAAYAIDALTPDEGRAYEQHLAGCERCQAELATLSQTAGSLALAVEPAEPPLELRERILAAARAERPNVAPLRPRRPYTLAAVAAVAIAAALALGSWALVLNSRNNGHVRALPITGAAGSVIVQPDGRAILVVAGLPRAPAGKTYEAWVISSGQAYPSGLFRAGPGTQVVRLAHRVPHAARVGVTLEAVPGAARPTSKPIVISTAA